MIVFFKSLFLKKRTYFYLDPKTNSKSFETPKGYFFQTIVPFSSVLKVTYQKTPFNHEDYLKIYLKDKTSIEIYGSTIFEQFLNYKKYHS